MSGGLRCCGAPWHLKNLITNRKCCSHKENREINNIDVLKYTSHYQVQRETVGACVRERERDFCVAIVTFTNLSSGFRPSMPHSHSAALPAILSIPPLLQVSLCIWTPPSHCPFSLWLFCIYLFIYFFFHRQLGWKPLPNCVQCCQKQWELKYSNTTQGCPQSFAQIQSKINLNWDNCQNREKKCCSFTT